MKTIYKAGMKEIIQAAMTAAGYRGRRDDFCRRACISTATFTRRIRDPESLTIGELRRIDRTAHIEDKDLLKLIRG